MCRGETEGTSDEQARGSVDTVEDKRSITTNTLGVQDALAERLERGDSVNSDNRLAIWTRCAGERRLALRARLLEGKRTSRRSRTETGTRANAPRGPVMQAQGPDANTALEPR